MGYRGLQWLRRITCNFKWIQRVTLGSKALSEVTGVIKG